MESFGRRRRRVQHVRWLCIVLFAAGLAGCAAIEPEYVYVDSVASDSAASLNRYVLLAQLPGAGAGQDVSAYVRRRHEKFVALTHEVLRSAGYVRVQSPDEAELVVALQYGVEVAAGPNRTERTSSVKLVGFDWKAVRDADHRNAIWRTHAYMDGSSGGLSHVVPQLLEAMRPYVGTNTDGVMELVLD